MIYPASIRDLIRDYTRAIHRARREYQAHPFAFAHLCAECLRRPARAIYCTDKCRIDARARRIKEARR